MMSSRFVALTLVVSLGAGSGVLAEQPLSQSASRAVLKVEQQQIQRAKGIASHAVAVRPEASRSEAQATGGAEPTVAKSGMRLRTKLLIYGAIGAGFAGSAYAIDRHVVDVTPSHLGTRHDGCKVFIFGC
jgi:hypothetical protein